MNTVLASVVAYLIGSISFAIVFSKLFRLADPRTYGSKNPGATNVLRSGNKAAAILTLIFDAAKGWFAVWLCKFYAAQYGFGDATIALVAVAAFLGHLYPVFHRFQGGKGVATALGVLFGIQWTLALAALAAFAVVVALTRYVSLASMVAAAFAVFYYAMSEGTDVIALGVLVMALLLTWRHKANIERLFKGTESKLGKKKAH